MAAAVHAARWHAGYAPPRHACWMNILFIAPLPPPITGHSLASQVFLDELRQTHNVEAVNLSVGTRHDGTVSARRLFEVAKVLTRVWRRQRRTSAIYLTISES